MSSTSMNDLSAPVSRALRTARSVSIEGSLGAAAAVLRSSGNGLVAVVENERYLGALTEMGLLEALSAGAELEDPIRPIVQQVTCVKPYETQAEAMRRLCDSPMATALVVDDGGLVWGVLSASDLFPKPIQRVIPQSVGGMATPFGVYLMAGRITGGVPKWGLAVSGAALMGLIFAGKIIAGGVGYWMAGRGINPDLISDVNVWLSLFLFAVLFRLSPIAGYHAAEHMVVHAIERREPLTPEVVSRMPRVHPRCGTNFATGIFIGTTIAFGNFGLPPSWQVVQYILALPIALAFWRPAGSFVQYWVTTRKPSRHQVEAGIKSGTQLLERYETAHDLTPSSWANFWNSGMLLVSAGAFATGASLALLFNAMGRLDLVNFNF